MKTKMENKMSPEDWMQRWIESVVSGESTMSQRKMSSIAKRDIDMKILIAEAKKQHVHLLLLKDDKGEEVIAASKDEFVVLC